MTRPPRLILHPHEKATPLQHKHMSRHPPDPVLLCLIQTLACINAKLSLYGHIQPLPWVGGRSQELAACVDRKLSSAVFVHDPQIPDPVIYW